LDAIEQRTAAANRAKAEAEAARAREDRIRRAVDTLTEREQARTSPGELTTHEPTEPEHEQQLRETEHPPADDDAEASGDLPEDLTEGPSYDPELLKSRRPSARQPVAVSLNAADARKRNGHG